MDSKIIAAIIIAVGFVAGVYLYVSDTPFNHCVAAYEKDAKLSHFDAIDVCLAQIRKD